MSPREADGCVTLSTRITWSVSARMRHVRSVVQSKIPEFKVCAVQVFPAQESDIEILSTNIKSNSLKFFYAFLADESATDIQWQDQWNQKYIPMGVRVGMTFLWPDHSKREAFFQKDILIPTGFWGNNKEEQI